MATICARCSRRRAGHRLHTTSSRGRTSSRSKTTLTEFERLLWRVSSKAIAAGPQTAPVLALVGGAAEITRATTSRTARLFMTWVWQQATSQLEATARGTGGASDDRHRAGCGSRDVLLFPTVSRR